MNEFGILSNTEKRGILFFRKRRFVAYIYPKDDGLFMITYGLGDEAALQLANSLESHCGMRVTFTDEPSKRWQEFDIWSGD